MKNKTSNPDLFIFAGEASGDLHGKNLIIELKKQNPNLNIVAVAGPEMRTQNISCFMEMENFQVMGFIDVLFALPKLIYYFYKIRKFILKSNPKASIFIDYPGFNLRLEKSLRKKGYSNKLIHYICPTVWAWAKNRINPMAQTLDFLLTILPFEKKHFSHTKLDVRYVGHPLIASLPSFSPEKTKNLIGIFPGSRKIEIERNFPLQLKAAKKLLENNPDLIFAVSTYKQDLVNSIIEKNGFPKKNLHFFNVSDNHTIMSKLELAIATSGTITLELALRNIPTIVTYAIKPLDLYIAQKILKIDLPFYCLVNIIMNKQIFPELFGPNLTFNKLYYWLEYIHGNEKAKNEAISDCISLKSFLEDKNASREAANIIIANLSFKN